MKLLTTIVLFAACSHLALAQGLLDQPGWRYTIHGDKTNVSFTDLRFDETDKVAGTGCLTYDAKGKPSSELWVCVRNDKLQEPVDLNSQQAVTFSYKLTARELTDREGKPMNSIGMGLVIGSSSPEGSVSFEALMVADDEWHEIAVPIEDLKSANKEDAGTWDRTDAIAISVRQYLWGLETADFALKIADLRFIPAASKK